MLWTPDISRYDAVQRDGTYHAMDWPASGLPFAILKASEGLIPDPAFALQWSAAKSLPRLAYHFLHTNLNAANQARKFLAALTDLSSTDFVAVGFETRDGLSNSQCLASLRSFLSEVVKQVPADRTLIYTYPGFWNSIGGATQAWAGVFSLWLAQWPWDNWFLRIKLPPFTWTAAQLAEKKRLIESGQVKPMLLRPWSSPGIWQFTARASPSSIPGYVGLKKAVDYNAIFMPLPMIPSTP